MEPTASREHAPRSYDPSSTTRLRNESSPIWMPSLCRLSNPKTKAFSSLGRDHVTMSTKRVVKSRREECLYCKTTWSKPNAYWFRGYALIWIYLIQVLSNTSDYKRWKGYLRTVQLFRGEHSCPQIFVVVVVVFVFGFGFFFFCPSWKLR